MFRENPLKQAVAAISVGMIDGSAILDLDYPLDLAADVDLNVVMTRDGRFVEVQGTAEGDPFRREELDAMLDLAAQGIQQVIALQDNALSTATI